MFWLWSYLFLFFVAKWIIVKCSFYEKMLLEGLVGSICTWKTTLLVSLEGDSNAKLPTLKLQFLETSSIWFLWIFIKSINSFTCPCLLKFFIHFRTSFLITHQCLITHLKLPESVVCQAAAAWLIALVHDISEKWCQ